MTGVMFYVQCDVFFVGRPPVRAVWLDYEVVEFQPRSGTTNTLYSVDNWYVKVFLILYDFLDVFIPPISSPVTTIQFYRA